MPALTSANLLENKYFDELIIHMWLTLLKIQEGGKAIRVSVSFEDPKFHNQKKKNTQQKILESSELQHSTSTFNNIKRSHVQGSAQGPAEPLHKLFSEKKPAQIRQKCEKLHKFVQLFTFLTQ